MLTAFQKAGAVLGFTTSLLAAAVAADSRMEGKVAALAATMDAQLRGVHERIDGVIRAQELASLRQLREARAALLRKADSQRGLTETERYELDQIEIEIQQLRDRLRGSR